MPVTSDRFADLRRGQIHGSSPRNHGAAPQEAVNFKGMKARILRNASTAKMETIVQESCDFVGTPRLNLEEWLTLLRATCGGDHKVIAPNAFAGWMRQLSVYGVAAAAIKIQCGLAPVDHGGNAYRYERTRRDIRLADTDWYCALFQVAGRSRLTQNDHTIQLGAGDIGLIDGARPSTRLSENSAQWLSIYLPHQSVMSHLGFEPQACLCGRGETLAARVLRQLVFEGIEYKKSTAARSGPPHATRPLRSTWRPICAV